MISKNTLAVIRNARYVQSNASKLLEMLSKDALPRITLRTLDDDDDDDAEMVAEEERKTLGLGMRTRLSEDSIDAFAQKEYELLREKIESLNILVMQAKMDIEEVRGFTLFDGNPKLILVNSQDTIRPRLFTLLHEYAHILLNTDGLCLLDLNDENNPDEKRDAAIEKWCNEFAGASIMPKKMMLEELYGGAGGTPQQVVGRLSIKFCSSRTATVVRILNLIGDDSRKKDYFDYYRTLVSKPIPKPSGGGGSGRDMASECINKHGRWYARLVSDSRDRGLITARDMTRYLDLQTKHFENLEGLI